MRLKQIVAGRKQQTSRVNQGSSDSAALHCTFTALLCKSWIIILIRQAYDRRLERVRESNSRDYFQSGFVGDSDASWAKVTWSATIPAHRWVLQQAIHHRQPLPATPQWSRPHITLPTALC